MFLNIDKNKWLSLLNHCRSDTACVYVLKSDAWVYSNSNINKYIHTYRANKKIDLDKNNMNSGLFKPDFMVFSTKRTTPINMFVVEVKPPNDRCCGLLNDTTKLCFEMKIILDIMVSLGIKNPTATGLCVEGRTWTGYRMKLEHEAVYMIVKLFDFQLPSTTSVID